MHTSSKGITMLIQYIQAVLEKAKYEIIDDEGPCYGEVPELEGVWATGKTLEECRRNLEEVIDKWLIFRLRNRLPIPRIGGNVIKEPGYCGCLNWSLSIGEPLLKGCRSWNLKDRIPAENTPLFCLNLPRIRLLRKER